MVELLRHRQTKEAATDMFCLPPPRHISTSTINGLRAASELGPLIPGQRTCSDYFSMSVSCQAQTSAALDPRSSRRIN